MCFVEDRFSIEIGLLGSLVGSRHLHVLADDDHRQQDQLQECLRNPGDDDDEVAAPQG
jgi:hypothetical protein